MSFILRVTRYLLFLRSKIQFIYLLRRNFICTSYPFIFLLILLHFNIIYFSRCNQCKIFHAMQNIFGGDKENRTLDPLLARQVLSQLSYTPIKLSLIWAQKTKQCKEIWNSVNQLLNNWYRPGSSDTNCITILLRKEVIQPHLPIRLPCYDFTPIIGPTFGSVLFTVRLLTSGVADSHGVTGGVYKARERIHGSMLTCHY